jgi:hypothetical protein
MKVWSGLCLWICSVGGYKRGSTLMTPKRSTTLAMFPNIFNRGAIEGFDHRFEQNFTDDPDFSSRFQRYLQIQQQIRTLENPSLNIQHRASLAKEWLEVHSVSSPTHAILQLWEDWNADSPLLDLDDTLGDAASTFPTTFV